MPSPLHRFFALTLSISALVAPAPALADGAPLTAEEEAEAELFIGTMGSFILGALGGWMLATPEHDDLLEPFTLEAGLGALVGGVTTATLTYLTAQDAPRRSGIVFDGVLVGYVATATAAALVLVETVFNGACADEPLCVRLAVAVPSLGPLLVSLVVAAFTDEPTTIAATPGGLTLRF